MNEKPQIRPICSFGMQLRITGQLWVLIVRG